MEFDISIELHRPSSRTKFTESEIVIFTKDAITLTSVIFDVIFS